MDQDLVIQRLINGALFLSGALLVGLAATWLVERVCRTFRLPDGLTVLAQVLTPVALFYAGSIYLDAAGAVAAATVQEKDERISYASRIPGGWNRSYWATVRFATTDGPTDAALWLDEATFDALHVGDAIDVRYVSWFPHLGRPATQSTRALVPWRLVGWALAAAGVGVVLWLSLRRRPVLMVALFLAAMAVGVIRWVYPTPWDTPLEAPVLTAEAEVGEVRDETLAFVSGRTLGAVAAPQPWQLVQLRFVPEGRDQPVIAVDGVDEGSVPGLTTGARVPIVYSARSPRDARLQGGTRTYRWREWLELGEYVALIGGAWLALWAIGRLFRMVAFGPRRHRDRRPRHPFT
jgi:hypothetical protein